MQMVFGCFFLAYQIFIENCVQFEAILLIGRTFSRFQLHLFFAFYYSVKGGHLVNTPFFLLFRKHSPFVLNGF